MIGIDWGVREIATTTSGAHDLPHPGYGRKAAAPVGLLPAADGRAGSTSPGARRKTKGYLKAQRQGGEGSTGRSPRQRQDTARKWAPGGGAGPPTQIAVEDFRPRFLPASTMARKAADAAIGATKRALVETAQKYGRTVHLVPSGPHHHGLRLLRCESQAPPAPLRENVYVRLPAASRPTTRSNNSARVMLVRAGLNPARC